MSYCRFENTANDLRDCIYAIEEGEYNDGISKCISKSEKAGLDEIFQLAHQLVNELKYDVEAILNSDYN